MARVNDVADNLNFPLSHIFHFRLSASRQGRGTETNNPVVTRRCRSPISPNSQFSSGRENVKFPGRAIVPLPVLHPSLPMRLMKRVIALSAFRGLSARGRE